MLRKSIIFFAALTVSVSCMDAFAVSSVRMLGTNAAPSPEKTVSVTPSLPAKANTALQAKSAKAPVVKNTVAEDSARLSGLGVIKTINTAKVKQQAAQYSNNTTPSSAGADEGLKARVEALEQQNANAITDVVETGTGNYVSDVTVGSNHKLNVSKTRLLYAPVRNDGSSNVVSDAEIWIVR